MTSRVADVPQGMVLEEQEVTVGARPQPHHSPMIPIIFLLIFIVFSERFQMDRGMNDMIGMADQLRSMADTLTSTVQGLQTAAAAPKALRQMRKLL